VYLRLSTTQWKWAGPCVGLLLHASSHDLCEEKITSQLFSSSAIGVLVEMVRKSQVTGMMKVAARHPR
jgi:hypothetical protein